MTRRSRGGSPGLVVTLDRVEEGLAVLVADDGRRITVPESALPGGTLEGSVLIMTLTPDPEETRRRLERVSELRRRLLDRDGSAD
jgi:hypothetical protein